MLNFFEELLKESFEEGVSVSDLLEKALEVVEQYDLPRHKFEWISLELKGYKDKTQLPRYRKVKGWKTSFHRRRLFRQSDTTHTRKKIVVPVLLPIDKIETLIETLAKKNLDATIERDQTERSGCYKEVSPVELGKIPQAVRYKFASEISNYLRQEPRQNLLQRMPDTDEELSTPKKKKGLSKKFWAIIAGIISAIGFLIALMANLTAIMKFFGLDG